jgi:hypothetical protein
MNVVFKKSETRIPIRTKNSFKTKPLWVVEVDGKIEFAARFHEAVRVYYNFLHYLNKVGANA